MRETGHRNKERGNKRTGRHSERGGGDEGEIKEEEEEGNRRNYVF